MSSCLVHLVICNSKIITIRELLVVIARTSHSDGVYTGFGIITFLLKSVSLAKLEELLNVPTNVYQSSILNKLLDHLPLKSIGAPPTLCAVNYMKIMKIKIFKYKM